jgi:hypothetical protein
MTTSVDRGGFVIGNGPFQPGAPLLATIDRLTAERDELLTTLQDVRNLTRAVTLADLESIIATAIPVEDVSIDSENGDGSIIITIEGVVADEDDELVAPVREFEVEYELTVRGSLTVNARDEDDANDIVDTLLANWSAEVENTEPDIDSEGVSFVSVNHPDVDFRIRDY